MQTKLAGVRKRRHLNHKRVQAVTDSIRRVELSKHNSMGGSFPQVSDPEFCCLEVWGVYYKLLFDKV